MTQVIEHLSSKKKKKISLDIHPEVGPLNATVILFEIF
jgi:hypothetical protein